MGLCSSRHHKWDRVLRISGRLATLPRRTNTPNNEPQTMVEQPNPVIRVMIVEDNPETLGRFVQVLSRGPRTQVVAQASCGRDAIDKLVTAKPDVLLVDLGLPDIHGTEVIQQARRLLPDCDIMVITLFDDESNVLASIEAGATGYVLKDSTDAQLVERVLELRAGGAPMSPAIARMVLHRMQHPGTAAAPASRNLGEHGILTSREIEVLGLLARGYVYSEIAERLGISLNTVASHIKNSYRKLAVHTGAAAVTRAAELGLLRSADPRQ